MPPQPLTSHHQVQPETKPVEERHEVVQPSPDPDKQEPVQPEPEEKGIAAVQPSETEQQTQAAQEAASPGTPTTNQKIKDTYFSVFRYSKPFGAHTTSNVCIYFRQKLFYDHPVEDRAEFLLQKR